MLEIYCPKLGRGGWTKKPFQQQNVCPPTPRSELNTKLGTANSESPQQNSCAPLGQKRNSSQGSSVLLQAAVPEAAGCSLLPPSPRLCSGWPGASAGPQCGGHTSSCPSWSSLWSSAGVSLPHSEAGNENKGRNGHNEEPGSNSWLFTEPQNH